MNHDAPIGFDRIDRDELGVTRNGEPAGTIRRFSRFECDAWTYDHGGTSLVGPLAEVKATLKRQRSTR